MRRNVLLALLGMGAFCQCGLMVDLNRLDSSSTASSGPSIFDAASVAPADAGREADFDGAPEAQSPDSDGVETDAGKSDDAESGPTGDAVTDACVLVRHEDGVGQTWQDCSPLGTYDRAEAMSACNAFGQDCIAGTTCNALDVFTFTGPIGNQTTHSWIYGAVGPVSLRAGDVLVFPRGNGPCNSSPAPVGSWR